MTLSKNRQVAKYPNEVIKYAETYNTTGVTAVALAAGLSDGATVIVDRDETRGDITVRYTVASGVLISPIDDALATDLADSSDPAKGAALVAYLPPGADAVPTNVYRKLTESRSIFDFLPPAVREAVYAGDQNQDLTIGIQRAVNSGATAIDFAGIVGICSLVTLNGVKNLNIWGNGARLRRPAGSGAVSEIFCIKGGCENIDLYGFDLLDGGYGAENLPTGGNPVIIIGDASGQGDGGLTNKNIRIFYNGITGSNWGGVVVYGRSNNDMTLTPLNEDIRVFHNDITDCAGNGVFVYKNALSPRVYGNVIDLTGQNSIVFDTAAETDTVTSEPIWDAVATDNICTRMGNNGFGSGVQFKGDVRGFEGSGNTVQDSVVTASGSFTNYGVLVTRDFYLSRPSNGKILRNTISNIFGSNSGVGILAGGCDGLMLGFNGVSDTKGANYQLGTNCTQVKIAFNDGENAGAGFYGYNLVGTSIAPHANVKVIGNTYKKGAAASTGGFRYDHINGGEFLGNDAIDFATTAEFITNCTDIAFLDEITRTGAPTSGLNLQGKRQNETLPSAANPVVQRVNTAVGDPGVWRPSSWVVGRAPTANRPVLTSADVGVMYFDTTLVAAGKPIWWTGLAWVDALGASV